MTATRAAWLVVLLLWPVALLDYLDRQMLAAMKFFVPRTPFYFYDIPSLSGVSLSWLLAALVLGARGGVGSTPRLPHVGLAAGPVGELRRRLEALGFFDWVRPEAAP